MFWLRSPSGFTIALRLPRLSDPGDVDFLSRGIDGNFGTRWRPSRLFPLRTPCRTHGGGGLRIGPAEPLRCSFDHGDQARIVRFFSRKASGSSCRLAGASSCLSDLAFEVVGARRPGRGTRGGGGPPANSTRDTAVTCSGHVIRNGQARIARSCSCFGCSQAEMEPSGVTRL